MSYPSSSLPPPPARRPGSPVPLWLPIAAGIAVVAVATLAVVMVAGGGTKSATTTTQAALTTSTTAGTSTTTSTSTTTTTTTVPGEEAGGSWTVLVYGLGDNNLEDDLLTDLEEMAAVPAAALQFVALVDRTPDYTDRALGAIGDWDTAKLLLVTAGPSPRRPTSASSTWAIPRSSPTSCLAASPTTPPTTTP